jgi:hypothetical protein
MKTDRTLKRYPRLLFQVGVFAVAMGFLEAIVVVYLRQLYYPQGFYFPLKILSPEMFSFELLREITTIVMLVVIGLLAGKNLLQKFSYFLYCFGIWDIFYYVGLKLLLNWPPSLLTWDVLFLIPVPWLGPVLAPIICSVTMILLAVLIIVTQEKGFIVNLKFFGWFLIVLGAFIIFSTFVWDYSNIIISGGFLSGFLTLGTNETFQNIISQHTPVYFNWYFFAIGEILIFSSVVFILKYIKSPPLIQP